MRKIDGVRLLRLMSILAVGMLILLALNDLILLVRALIAPEAEWTGTTLTTALPGFELPVVHFDAKLIYVGRQLATLALAALVVVPITGIVRSIDREGPFHMSNVTRLRLVASGCTICGVAPLLVPLVPMSIKIPLGLLYGCVDWLAVGLALTALALSEIFKRGINYREDSDATI